MRIFILIITFLLSSLIIHAQVPPEISKIFEKMQTGKDLTEAEEQALEKWGQEMEKQFEGKNAKPGKGQPNTTTNNKAGASGKKIGTGIKLQANIPVITKESYIQLAKSVMQTFGPKSGDLPGIERLLLSTDKSTDGADYGALFMMEGAGAAGVYACAWSAVKEPVDILTANNLAVALKNEGEYVKALQVLNYANTIKPGIGLILSNRGWVYFNAGEYVKAKTDFNAALKVSPGMTSPYLGLGLIAQWEGNNFKAKEYLRKALKDRYSAAGVVAYRQAQESASSQNQSADNPISEEKESSGTYNAPSIPVYQEPHKMAPQETILRNHLTKVNSRLDRIMREIDVLTDRIMQQQQRAMQNPDNALVYNRDFAKEMMMLEDIELLLWGKNSNYGKAVSQSSSSMENSVTAMEQNGDAMLALLERVTYLDERLQPLYERMVNCNGNEACMELVKKEMDPYLIEKEQVNFKICKLGKQQVDLLFAGSYKSLSMISSEFRQTAPDYYAFTSPVLEKIYAPALNELYNLRREAKVLSEEIMHTTRALGLAEDAANTSDMECKEPEAPESSDEEISNDNAPVKKPEPCPLGEEGLQAGIGAFSFQLTCTFVKVSGGEGVLASVKRDFVKHETTLWAGVGAKAEFAHGNLTGEATVGAEITVGQNTVKDVAFTSSVKAGVGRLMETEVSGRIALEGGASMEMNTEFLP